MPPDQDRLVSELGVRQGFVSEGDFIAWRESAKPFGNDVGEVDPASAWGARGVDDSHALVVIPLSYGPLNGQALSMVERGAALRSLAWWAGLIDGRRARPVMTRADGPSAVQRMFREPRLRAASGGIRLHMSERKGSVKPQVTGLIAWSRGRPQQDSNLRTRLGIPVVAFGENEPVTSAGTARSGGCRPDGSAYVPDHDGRTRQLACGMQEIGYPVWRGRQVRAPTLCSQLRCARRHLSVSA